MKAIGFTKHLPIDNPDSFIELDLPDPVAQGHDILVRVKAVSVNPVDTKVRNSGGPLKSPRIIGWDAAGLVEAIGDQVTLFQPGDEVYYAGALNRQGSNSELQLVDERIVAKKPQRLNFEESAAMPLTTLVAWEAIFDRLKISQNPEDNTEKNILIINGAGGVGSIATQIAKKVAGLKVVATCSSKNEQWVKEHGADEVIDYKNDIVSESLRLKRPEYDYILCLYDTQPYWDSMVKLIAPFGMIASITGLGKPIDLDALKSKSAGFVWAYMFTRPSLGDYRMLRQHDILNQAASLFDQGSLRSTLTKSYGELNIEHLKQAHAAIEEGHIKGKITLSVR